MTTADLVPADLAPGAMAVTKTRVLPGGGEIAFEAAPAGWPDRSGKPRVKDWRRYTYREPGADKARVLPSVTTVCDAILPKQGLFVWSERQGIRGAVEAMRRGLLTAQTDDEEAVQVVRRYQLGADRARDEAADRGLNVHAILEEYMASGHAPNPADHPGPHRPFIRGLVRWLLKCDPQPVAVEALVADPEREYAGRADLIARVGSRQMLIDLKSQESGAIYESAHVQVRLYWEAEERFGEHRIEDALIVVVDGAGGFREMELVADASLGRQALDFYRQIKPLCSACDQQNRVMRDVLKEAAA